MISAEPNTRKNSLSCAFNIDEAIVKFITPTKSKQFDGNPLKIKSHTVELPKKTRPLLTQVVFSYGDVSELESVIDEESTQITQNLIEPCLQANSPSSSTSSIHNILSPQVLESSCSLFQLSQLGNLDENVINDFECIRSLHLYEEEVSYATAAPSGKPILALDLDETLVHTVPVIYASMFSGRNYGKGVTLKGFHLILRPFLKYFLEEVEKYYELRVFTSAEEQYATEIIKVIDPNSSFFKKVYTRSSCRVIDGKHIKDLSVLDSDLRKVILLDNSVVSFCMNLDNGIYIKPFMGSSYDTELQSYASLLKDLSIEQNIALKVKEQFNTKNLLKFYIRTSD